MAQRQEGCEIQVIDCIIEEFVQFRNKGLSSHPELLELGKAHLLLLNVVSINSQFLVDFSLLLRADALNTLI